MRTELIETLRQAQRFGFLGERPVEQAAEHSRAFATAIGELAPGTRVIDLGSGGGLPGLVLAELYPQCRIVLLDRRQKRTDFLARAIARLGYAHTTVVCEDAEHLARQVTAGEESAFEVVTARGFGPPERTLRLARLLVGVPGTIVISEPPKRERWDPLLLSELGLVSEAVGPVRRFDTGPEIV
jgi:16S rRNA (guanine527-N7)-methyltransferase